MSFLGSALGLTAMCSLGWGNLVGFDWNDLLVGREFDWKFLKKVKSPPYALPPPPAGITLIGALTLHVLQYCCEGTEWELSMLKTRFQFASRFMHDAYTGRKR